MADSFTDDELRTLAERHLSYEVSSLWRSAVEHYLTTGDTERDWTVGNALLEAALLHARVLDEFLGARQKFPDDVRAKQYITGYRVRALHSKQLKNIDKTLVHLTTHRRTIPRWQMLDVVERVTGGMQKFITELPLHRRGWFVWFEDEMERFGSARHVLVDAGRTTTAETVLNVVEPQR